MGFSPDRRATPKLQVFPYSCQVADWHGIYDQIGLLEYLKYCYIDVEILVLNVGVGWNRREIKYVVYRLKWNARMT